MNIFFIIMYCPRLDGCGTTYSQQKQTNYAYALNSALCRWRGVTLIVFMLLFQALMHTAVAAPIIEYQVKNRYPHDAKAYTQGLVWHQGMVYESTGLRGQSSLRKTRLRDGRIMQLRTLGASLFAEGIAIADAQIVQLTWTSQVLLRYRLADFSLIERVEYPHQGWGIAYDGQRFIVSDGSATLRFLDLQSLEVIDQITVFDEDQPLSNLNELEFVNHQLFANVWQSNRIARIDVSSGSVTGWLDLSQLVEDEGAENDAADVLNGIAWLADEELLLVTGKFWAHLYALQLLN